MIKMATILIVDDNETNRNVLNELVLSHHHTPKHAKNGKEAIELLQKDEKPHLILLDILMPEMDGYETLKRIKEDESLRNIPVVMITAIDDVESAARCIKSGADDYLVKPFNPTLLKARIDSCLERKFLRDKEEFYQTQLENINKKLEAKYLQTARRALETEKEIGEFDKTKNGFLRLIAHELRTPLQGLFSSADLLFSEHLDSTDKEEYRAIFQSSSDRLLKIVEDALLITRLENSSEEPAKENLNANSLLKAAIEKSREFATFRKVDINNAPDCSLSIACDKYLITEAFSALLETAIKFASAGTAINITCSSDSEEAVISINAKGKTVPEEFINTFFNLFATSGDIVPGGDIGLRPPLAKCIINKFDGKVSIENVNGEGISLIVKMRPA